MSINLSESQKVLIKSALIALSTIQKRKKVHLPSSSKWQHLHQLEQEIVAELYAHEFGPDEINEVGVELEELNLLPMEFLE